MILGRGLSGMRLMNHQSNGFLLYSLKSIFKKEDQVGSGTIFKAVNKKDLQDLKLLVPTYSCIEDFHAITDDLDKLYLNNYSENKTLKALRDILLPKLISGEVRLKEFRDQVEEVL